MTKYVLPCLFLVCSGAVCAQICLQNPNAFHSWVNQGEPYSIAVCKSSDPQKLFQEANAGLLQATTDHRRDPQSSLKLDQLAKAAKAALEAGLNEKAKSYAQQALTLAQRDRCVNSPVNKPSEPRRESSIGLLRPEDPGDQAERDFCTSPFQQKYPGISEGDAVATSSLVLGRLALLNGDVKQAEMFLLQSGQIMPGSNSSLFGPNMTLALELLKRQRTEVVLRFLDEWSKIWRGEGRMRLRHWTTAIRQGAIPDFGANLLL